MGRSNEEPTPPTSVTESQLADAGPMDDHPPISREQRRSRRKRKVRAKTMNLARITKRDLELGRLLYPLEETAAVVRPKTRADCVDGVRPCPFVSCKHHLYLDVSARNGSIKLNFPDLEPHELADDESCSLDVAARDGVTLEEVGRIMNLTRERVRQVETKGLAKIQALKEMQELRAFVDVGPVGKRRLPVLRVVRDEEETQPSDSGFDIDRFASDDLD